jgi:diguanylate cyclase (GGDEF)-like protein/PAS domain S-box-containing protein
MEHGTRTRIPAWQSLKTRATVFTLAIFVLGIWSLSLFVSRSLQADMQRLMGEQQFSVVTAVAKEVNGDLTERLQALETVAKEMDASLMDSPAALQARLEQRPLLQLLFNGGVWVAGLDGTAIADVPRSANRLGINYMDRDFIVAPLKEGKSVIGRPVMGKQLKAPVFSIAVPIHDAQGKVIGVIVGVTNLGKPSFLDKITESRYGQTGGYFLIAPQHQLFITATDRSRVMQPLPAPGLNTMHDRYMQGYEGYGVAVSSRGVLELSAAKAIPVAGWYAATILPAQEAFAPIADMQKRLLWATLLLTLLTGILIWWVLKHQLAPLGDTADAMVALAGSKTTQQPLPDTHPGEIGQLVTGFNRILQTWAQREAALRASEQNLAITLNSIGDAVMATDAAGLITHMNPTAERLTAWPLADALGKPLTDVFRIISAQTRLPAQNPVQLVMEHGKVVDLANHTALLARDGGEHQIADSAAPIRNAADQIVGVVLVFSDVTEKYRVELALVASEARWKFAIEGAGDGLWDWNIQTGKAFYSPRYKTMLGFTEDEIGDTADEWTKRIHPDDAPGVYAALQPYMDGKPGSAAVEFRMLCKDGSWQWTAGRGMVVERDADGKPVRMIGTNSDITSRKQAEQYEHFRRHTMEQLAANAPLAALLETIVRSVEELHPAMLCSILLLDADGRHLIKGVAPSLPDFYNAALDGIEIGVGVGSCGTAAFTGERVIVTDISTHPYWAPYKDLAASAGLGACWSQPIRGTSGQVLGTFAIYHRAPHTPVQADIDLIEQTANLTSIAIERRQAQEKLQLAAGVFTHAREAIMITGPDSNIMDVNATFTRITGYTREESLGQNPRMLSSGRQGTEFYAALWQSLSTEGYWSGEIWNRRKSGEVYAVMQTISAVRDAQGNAQHFVALFSDITAIKEHQSQLEHIAHFDALTNLPNRVLLADRLQQAMAQAQRRGQQLAVAYLDLDGFKAINDRHGHEAGDQVLIALAQRMKDALREGDTLARLGGDEFVAVLIDLEDTSASVPLLNRLLAAAALPVPVGELSLQVSASLGVTFFPQTQEIEADQLLRQADQAMYQAKVAGKNRYHVFDAEQDSSIRGHHESLERIRLALARGEFVLHYQPKVNMRSGQVVGAEALIRWQHPERGLLPPGTFLPVIEDNPMAVDVGEWVIGAALTQIAAWRATGLDLPVSVNIGARQLQQADFVERLQAILARHPQVHPGCIELEVLETSALADMAQVSQVIEDCAQMGVKFALDDFGTGYSSLTYLKRLRVALLKIDQSFVRDMLDDPDDLAILQGVIGLAAAFKREVIAEGVETVEHGTALLHLGCELAQGYGIARPMPPEQMPAWAATWQPDTAWCELPWLGGVT